MTDWTVNLEGDRLRVWGKTRGGQRAGVADICIDRSTDDNGPSKLEHDRARLIAAAPDLLAALEEFTAQFGTLHKTHSLPLGLHVAFNQAERVIAKAHNQ